MLMEYGYGKSIRSVTIGYPIDMCPLQAADLVAFEIRCQERDDGRPQTIHDVSFRKASRLFRVSKVRKEKWQRQFSSMPQASLRQRV